MKKIRIITLGIILAMLSLIITGCNSDEIKLLDAMSKMAKVNSLESKSSFTLHFNAQNLSEQEKEIVKYIKPYLDNLKFDVDTKSLQNEAKTKTTEQVDLNVNVGGVGFGSSFWVDLDATGATPKAKVIAKIPPFLSGVLPSKEVGKEYFVIDLNDLNVLSGGAATNPDYNKSISFGNEVSDKIMTFVKDFAIQFDPKFDVATRKADVIENGESLAVYELKLDDKSLKDLLKYTGNNCLQSDKFLDFVKEIAYMYIDNMGTATDSTLTKAEFDKQFADFKTSIPETLKAFNEFFDSIKDFKILGEKGIVVDYKVDKDGYVVSEKGSVDISLNILDIVKLMQETMGVDLSTIGLTGTYNLGIDYNTENSNINKNIEIPVPETNKENSLTFTELMKYQTPAMLQVDNITTSSKAITGVAEAGSTVTYQYFGDNGQAIVGTTVVNSTGVFSFRVSNLKAEGMVSVSANNGYNTNTQTLFVIDKTPPAAPKVNKVTYKSTSITGKAEAASSIIIKRGSTKIGSGKTAANGTFSIKISKQKIGTKLTVSATDYSGNRSSLTKVTVSKVTVSKVTVSKVTVSK